MKSANRQSKEVAGLKRTYLALLGTRSTNFENLRITALRLHDAGVTRKQLKDLAVQGGYTKKNAASLLSRIFCRAGLRARKAGAGRRPSPRVVEHVSQARQQYGGDTTKVLRAAWRLAKTQDDLEKVNRRRSGGNCGSTIRLLKVAA
jgi:hypothetical protein